jgi:nitrogenase-stabilizing/protective protein
MSDLQTNLSNFSAAEEFLDFFGIDYQPTIVHVNRLHILKRFNQYLQTNGVWKLDVAAQHASAKDMLIRAYQDFVRSTPAQEKVFKVFQDADGQHQVSLEKLRATLPSQGNGG